MRTQKGFTLIELLVVIAIIALLMAIIMPSLQAAKEIAATTVCLANQKQLGMAYYLYAEDNDGNLVDGAPVADSSTGWKSVTVNSKTYNIRGFIAEPMDENGNFQNDSLDDKIRGFEKGGLWSYLETHEVFNCPADKRWRKPPTDTTTIRGAIGGYRSYSIGTVLSVYGINKTSTGENEAAILKYSGFTNPSGKIVFLEEADASGYNHFTWNLFLNKRQWFDPFAIWHNGSSTFSYADGHADRFKWTDEVMIDMASLDSAGNKNRAADQNSDDYEKIKRMYMPR